MKTVAMLVREQCANFKDNGCICKNGNRCPVIDGGRCDMPRSVLVMEPKNESDDELDYFSACLAPMVKNFPEYTDAVINYQRSHNFGKATTVKKRTCGCGNVLGKRQRFCDDCIKKNRKATWRDQKEKQRQTVIGAH